MAADIKLTDEFEIISRAMIEFLNRNYNPHVSVIITPTTAELVSGEMAFTTEDYIRDDKDAIKEI